MTSFYGASQHISLKEQELHAQRYHMARQRTRDQAI